jgi:hypothetical protein
MQQRTTVQARTVQDYIDETPFWADGTAARAWWLSVAGKFFEGLVVFMTGVALPLVGKEFELTATEHGLVSAAALFGILVGASALGSLSDDFGRKTMFVFEIMLFTLSLALIVFAQKSWTERTELSDCWRSVPTAVRGKVRASPLRSPRSAAALRRFCSLLCSPISGQRCCFLSSSAHRSSGLW